MYPGLACHCSPVCEAVTLRGLKGPCLVLAVMDDHHRRFTVCSLFVVANLLVLLNMFGDRGGVRVSGDPERSRESSPLYR